MPPDLQAPHHEGFLSVMYRKMNTVGVTQHVCPLEHPRRAPPPVSTAPLLKGKGKGAACVVPENESTPAWPWPWRGRAAPFR